MMFSLMRNGRPRARLVLGSVSNKKPGKIACVRAKNHGLPLLQSYPIIYTHEKMFTFYGLIKPGIFQPVVSVNQ